MAQPASIFAYDTMQAMMVGMFGDHGVMTSTGIPYVLVNGVVMVKDSKVQDGQFPGQPLRFAAEQKGRFQPLAKKRHLENLLGTSIPDDLLDRRAGEPPATK